IGSYHYPGELDFNEFLGIALDKGLCALLLDGLDEVGDVGDTLVKGKTLRSIVLAEVQRFTRQRCGDSCSNRVVVTSRLEGYHRGDLDGFDEMELSALSIPDEVREFLLRWFAAHEQKNHPNDALDEIYRRAQLDVDSLMTDIMRSASVQRLAINPLLLTILAMIHKLGTRLPNERVKLYQIVTQTMVESWRQAQTRGNISIYEVLKASRITPMMASLAYWVHENHPGGAMPETEWKQRIQRLLQEKDDEMGDEAAAEVAEMFMRHAREEVGLLIERSPGQIGLFHLTLEEYLAGVEIASRKEADRRAMLAKHWKNPRWREAILLAAGQLMLNGSQELDTFVLDLRMRDDQEDEELLGLPALMAGSAIADVGAEHFMKKVVRETRSELATVATMFSAPATRRAECADLADELGYDPGDLYAFVPIRGGDFAKHPGRVSRPGTAEAVTTGEFYLARYPVTNLQYERFLRRENFEEESLWRDFPKYDEKGNFMPGQTWGDTGWKWLQGALKEEDYLIEDGVLLPRYWRDPRFGIARKSAPVVGISWYEANAYCRWLAAHWQGEPEAGSLRALVPGRQGFTFRLPTEAEWVTAAGGDRDNRFAWGLLEDEKEISRYANTDESGVNRTTPVWAYPQGESPLQVMDMSGNVWEWMANFYDKDQDYPSVRGGSWYYVRGDARVSVRSGADPYVRDYILGFRGVFAPHLHHNSEL
ncbi:MAG: NACHT domain-containing protein, partial [Chloroflexota bacterium]